VTPVPDPLARLAAGAEAADRDPSWPDASWRAIRDAGVLRWSIPPEYSGDGRGPVEVLAGNEALASACLTTAFVLSQREAAVRRLFAGPDHLKARVLPGLAAGDLFLTVGLSQLTTSRQHGGPALRATPTATGFRLDGEVPWVTGADRADALVVGATLPDRLQALFVLPADTPGVSVGPPMELAALRGSRTAGVRCDGVELAREWLLAGPADHVLGRVGGGGLETSALALGLAGAAADWLRDESARRPELVPVADRFDAARSAARGRLHDLAASPDPDRALPLRADCTRLALRATQAALLAAKGAGFVAPHPAGRWARQALFFLVWSCPRPVADGVLTDLLAGI
jgi:alkylation response protein AidB-like acyl-CoA dehydrogenase